MEYISSDTNVWLDFAEIERLNLPFLLPYVYLMNDETVEDELLSPPGLCSELLQLGLQKTELTEEEFYLVEVFSSKYIKPSVYDCFELAIDCIWKLLEKNGGKVRLPRHELEKRLQII